MIGGCWRVLQYYVRTACHLGIPHCAVRSSANQLLDAYICVGPERRAHPSQIAGSRRWVVAS